MVEYNAGDAKLQIVPDASGFKAKLDADLEKIKASFDVTINFQIAQARADMERFRTAQESRAMKIPVDFSLAQAKADLDRFRTQQQQNAINVPVHADTVPARAELTAFRASQHANPINLPVKTDPKTISQAQSQLGQLNKVLGETGKLFGSAFSFGKTLGIVGLVANVPAAVTGLFSLTQAIQTLGQAGLALPGIMAAAGASIGTLALGLSGISEAYQAVSAAAEGSGRSQAEQARAVSSAQHSLSNAVQDETRAQRDVTTARRDALNQLRDLNLELRGSAISEAEAQNNLAAARRDLAQGQFKDSIDARDAQLRVARAEQSVLEAHQRGLEVQQKTADANAKGVENSDLLVDANRRLADSHEATLAAQASLTDALGITGGAADKAATAMGKLSPQARDFVDALIDLKPQFTDLKKTVSGNLFEGMGASFSTMISKVLPNIKTGMGSIATALNNNFKTLFASLGSDSSRGLLDRILGNTADAQARFSRAIEPLVHAFETLTAAGSDALPRLANAMGDIATRFDNFITAADQDGRLSKWIDEGLTGFTNLGNILINIGKSFGSIHDALGGGQGILGSLRTLTEKWAAWLASTEGQNKLKKWFEEGKKEIEDLKPIVGELIQTLPKIWDSAKGALDAFLPVLNTVMGVINAMPGGVQTITNAFLVWKTLDFSSKVISSIDNISSALGSKGKGKHAKGGKGLLGKIGLVAVGLMAIGALEDFDFDSIVDDSGGTDTDTDTGAGAPASGDAPPSPGGQQPASQQPSFGNVPGANLTPGAVQGPVTGAVSGAVLSGGNPLAALGGAFLGVEAPKTPSDSEKIYNSLVFTLPMLDDATMKTVADMMGMTPEELKAISRDDLKKKLNESFAAAGLPTFAAGGPTDEGIAMLHDDEFVQRKSAVGKYGLAFMHALNQGKIDPKMLPGFSVGGGVPLAPPVIPPPVPAPAPVVPAPAVPAPAPAQVGIVGTGPLPGPVLPDPQYLPPGVNPDPLANLPAASTQPQLPGIFGTLQTLLRGTPAYDDQGNAILDQAGQQTYKPIDIGANLKAAFMAPWMKGMDYDPDTGQPTGINFMKLIASMPEHIQPQNIAAQFGSTLLGGVLGFFGLENSILSPDNLYNQSIKQVGGHLIDMVTKGAGADAADTGITGNGIDPNTTTHGAGAAGSTGVGGAAAPGGHIIGTSPASMVASIFGTTGGGVTLTPELLKEKGFKPLYDWSDTTASAAARNPQWIQDIAKQFNLTASTYSTGGTLHEGGYAWDFNGSLEDQDRFAEFITTNLAGQTLQLIHEDPNTGQKWGIAGGSAVGPGTSAPNYYSKDWAAHGNHVHWAVDVPANIADAKGSPLFGDFSRATTTTSAVPGGAGSTVTGIGSGDTSADKFADTKLGQGSFAKNRYSAAGRARAGTVKELAHAAMLAMGWPDSEWSSLDQLVEHESGWQPTAKNPSSTAYGLFQFLDTTWADVGAVRTSEPEQQIAAGLAYIRQRYGRPSDAWGFWLRHLPHWYAGGGAVAVSGQGGYGTPLSEMQYEDAQKVNLSLPGMGGLGKLPKLLNLFRNNVNPNSRFGQPGLTPEGRINLSKDPVTDAGIGTRANSSLMKRGRLPGTGDSTQGTFDGLLDALGIPHLAGGGPVDLPEAGGYVRSDPGGDGAWITLPPSSADREAQHRTRQGVYGRFAPNLGLEPGNFNPDIALDTSRVSTGSAPLWQRLMDKFAFNMQEHPGYAHGMYEHNASIKPLPHLAFGGGVPGIGSGDTVPAMLTPGEHVLTTADVKALGGQSGVYALRQRLHFERGGGVPQGLVVPDPSAERARQAIAKQIQRPPGPQGSILGPSTAPSQPKAPAAAPPAQGPPGAAAPAPPAPPGPEQQGSGPSVFAPSAESTSHNLPALSTGIKSGANLAATLASSAIGAAGGAIPGAGAGAGALGAFVGGLIQEGGKVVDAAVNVASSFLVGNVTMPTQFGAYGQTFRPTQNQPVTAGNTNTVNYNGGMVVADPYEMRRELDLRDSQHFQSQLANH